MQLPQTDNICCPNCRQAVAMTAAAVLQSRQFGVLCDCKLCGNEWIHTMRQRDSHGPRRIDAPQRTGDRPHLKLMPTVRQAERLAQSSYYME